MTKPLPESDRREVVLFHSQVSVLRQFCGLPSCKAQWTLSSTCFFFDALCLLQTLILPYRVLETYPALWGPVWVALQSLVSQRWFPNIIILMRSLNIGSDRFGFCLI